ncbi:MAG TPA: DUF433 domain-containing protein [Parafilimonas sp.]
MKFDRISINLKVMMGKPCIKGTRITVELILEKLAQGADYKYLLDGYPNLTIADILAAIAYAHAVLTNEKIIEAETA